MGKLTSLAVIPARGGSKRIPRKNLADLGGIPLVLWTARAAMNSELLTRHVVSTEDEEIAEICRADGHQVSMRPAHLAEDAAWSAPVVAHHLRESITDGFNPDLILLLHPTSPFRDELNIDRCLAVAEDWPGSIISFMNDDLNGAIYVARSSEFLRNGSFFHSPIWPYNMDRKTGMDIDTPEQLEAARDLLLRS